MEMRLESLLMPAALLWGEAVSYSQYCTPMADQWQRENLTQTCHDLEASIDVCVELKAEPNTRVGCGSDLDTGDVTAERRVRKQEHGRA